VVVRLFKSDDVRLICERSLTPRLFRLIFTGPAACRKAAAEDEDEEPTKRVDVSGIETRGKEATAHARLVGGDTPGAKGPLSLRRGTNGWRVDDISTAFLRSSVEASLKTDDDIPRVEGRCLNGRFTRMPDDEFKRFAYSLLGQRPQATVRFFQMLSRCDRRKGGVSTIRRAVEKSVVKELRGAGADRKAFPCVLRRLRTTLPEELLIRLVARDDRRSRAQITREAVAAAVACGIRPRRAPGQLSPA
jgi:hypothetical protein